MLKKIIIMIKINIPIKPFTKENRKRALDGITSEN